MRNQKLETELAYKSAKCYTLRQCGVITDPPQYIHTQHGVFFVAHTAIIVRTSKKVSCLSQIFLILKGVSRDGRKTTITRKHLTISFGARRNRCKTDKIAFFNFKNIHFSSNKRLSNREHSLFVYLLLIFFEKPEINRPDVFAEPPVLHSTDCQPCLGPGSLT